MSEPTSENSSPSAKAACVVWCPEGSNAPGGLMKALQAKGLTTTQVSNGYTALASLLRLGMAGGVVVLVIVEPGQQPRSDEVNAALDRYAPRAARWTFVATDQPPLQVARGPARKAAERTPIEAPERVEAKPEPAMATRPPIDRHSGPMLRLTGLGVLDVLDSDGEDDSEGAGLTSEEMAALLSDDSHEGRSS